MRRRMQVILVVVVPIVVLSGEFQVKEISLVRWAVSAMVVLSAATVHAQGSETQVVPQAAPGSVPSAKSIRAANRQLAKAVRRALVKVKGLDSGNIVVVAKGGTVLLGGSVPDASQIELAVSSTKGVNGVVAVNNSLSIKALGQ
jgi:hyperosmotically inducible protein